MATPKKFSYLNAGAPQLSGRVGKTAAILDFALADGTSTITCSSVVVSTLVATLVLATAADYAVNDWVTISGATGIADVNGTWQVRSKADSTHYTLTVTGGDGVATGLPVIKRSPLGFAKTTGTNLRNYRAATGERKYLALDDTAAADSVIHAFDAMSDVDSGTGPFPTTLEAADGLVWKKNDQDDGGTISLTSIEVVNGVATVVSGTAHGLKPRDKTTIANAATITDVNGVQRVTSVSSPTTFTFNTTSVDGDATGSPDSTKYVVKKWFLVGDAKWFHYFVERYNDVYDVYSFGETAPVLDATITTIVTGLNGGDFKVYGSAALVSGTLETYDSDDASILAPAVNAAYAMGMFTNTKTLFHLNSTDKVSSLYVKSSGYNKGAVKNLYASNGATDISHGNGVVTTVKPEGNPSASLQAWKVIMGPQARVGNVFVDIA